MISRKRVLEMIEAGEGLCVEFKQRFSSHEKIAKEIIAFANTRGGFILFGVDDDKSLYGVESEKSDLELIKGTAEKYCEPPVEYNIQFIEVNGKDVLIVQVQESKIKPHRLQDYKSNLDLNGSAVYIRVNDKSVLASKEMIKLLQTQRAGNSLKNYEGISFVNEPEGHFSNRWLTTIIIDPSKTNGKTREVIRLDLEKDNIESRPLWRPMHLQPIFENYPKYTNGNSERLFNDGL